MIQRKKKHTGPEDPRKPSLRCAYLTDKELTDTMDTKQGAAAAMGLCAAWKRVRRGKAAG